MSNELFNEIIQELEKNPTFDYQYEVLGLYLDKAEKNKQYLPALEEIANLLFLRGYNIMGIQLLIEMYKIKPSPRKAIKIAEQLYQQEEYEIAYTGWMHLAKQSSENYKLLLLEARLLNKLYKVTEAVKVYKYITEKHPTKPEAYEELGDLYVFLAEYEKAGRYYKAVLDYLTDYERVREIRMKLVNLELNSEKMSLETMEDIFNRQELPIELPEEYFALAKVYEKAQRYEQAILYAVKAMELDKDNINYSMLLMKLYHYSGKESKLFGEINWLIKTIPVTDERIYDIAKVARDMERLNDDIIEKLLYYYPFIEDETEAYDVIDIIMMYYIDNEKAEEGHHALRNFDDPSISEEYLSYYYAKVYEQLALYDKVEEYYLTAIHLAIDKPDLIYDTAKFYEKTGDNQKAVDLLKKYSRSSYTADKDKLKAYLKVLEMNEINKPNDEIRKWREENGYE